MPEPRTLRRIVKATGGQQAFKIATVKRDPFKQEYIDLCSSSFDEALGGGCAARGGGDGAQDTSLFDQVALRGRHALERSEIIKAQSVTLGKQVTGALRVQASAAASKQSAAADSSDESDDGDSAQQPSAVATLNTDEILRRYNAVRGGEPEPLPLKQIFAGTAFAEPVGSEVSASAPAAAADVGALIRMQAAPSLGMLLRDPDALRSLMDFAADAPPPSLDGLGADNGIDEFPPNSELLALIEDAATDEDELLSEDEDESASCDLAPVSMAHEEDHVSDDNGMEQDADDPAIAASSGDLDVLMLEEPSIDVAENAVASEGGDTATRQATSSLQARGSEDPSDAIIPDATPAPIVQFAAATFPAPAAAKPKRAKKPRQPESKHGKLLVDPSKPMPDLGPPPKAARKTHSPRPPSELTATLVTPWSRRAEPQPLCARTSVISYCWLAAPLVLMPAASCQHVLLPLDD
jgi:hypothetical protein